MLVSAQNKWEDNIPLATKAYREGRFADAEQLLKQAGLRDFL